MTLLKTFNNFVKTPESARKAIFEAAMIERIKEGGEGYKMCDMLYELCDAQSRLEELEDKMETLEARFDKRAKKKVPKCPDEDDEE